MAMSRKSAAPRERILYLILIMTVAALSTAGLTIWLLYETAFAEQKSRLAEIASSQARLIEAIARFNAAHDLAADSATTTTATLQQVAEAHGNHRGFGETGEFTLARRDGDQIAFLLKHRHSTAPSPLRVPWQGEDAEPMRRALKGLAGTTVARDYRGAQVLAAHEPVSTLALGIVAKIDLAEIRSPFITAALVSLAGGLVVVVIGALLFWQIMTPLLQRQRIEAALGESERRFRDFADAASDWLWEMDAELRFTFLSEAFEQGFGWQPERSLGQRKQEIYRHIATSGSAEEQAQWRQHFADLEAHRPFSNFLQRWVTPAGETRYVLNSGKPIHDDDGRFAGYRGTASNVTDLIETQKALVAIERRYRVLVDATPAIILTLTPDGKIDYVNPYFERLSGYALADIRGKDWFDTFLPARDRERVRALFAAAIDAASTHGNVNPIVTRWGEEREVEWSDAVLRDETDTITALLAIGADVTTRVQAQQALLASEQRYRALVESGAVGVMVSDLKYRPFYFSDLAIRLFGYDSEADMLTVPTLRDLIIGVDDALMDDISRRARAGDQVLQTSEVKCRRKDGAVIWLLQSSTVIHWNGERAIQTTVVDLTDRKQAERALQDSEARLLEAQRIGDMGSWERDIATDSLHWSDQVFRIFGLEPGDVEPSYADFESRIHPDDLPIYEDLATRARAGGKAFRAEHRIVRPDGSIRIVVESAEVIKDRQGNPVRVIGTVHDVTTLREAERALQDQEAAFSAVVENSPFSLMLKDIDGHIRLVNATFEKWFGRLRSDLQGHTSEAAHSPEVSRRMYALDAQVLRERAPIESVEPVILIDGREHQLRLTKFPVMSANNEIVGIGSIGVDETERRQLEDRLRQSEKMQAIGLLTGGIAHEFNNMIQVIQVNAELLAETIDGDEATSRRLEALRRTAERGGQLTSRLLAFSRRQALWPEPTNVADLVGDTVELLDQTLGANFEIATEIADTVWPVHIDQGELQNALFNLAINARDAMPHGGRITISAGNCELTPSQLPPNHDLRPGPYVRLAVIDSGAGMPATVRAQAFEPFFTTKPVGMGTGLGLSMVYGFAQQSGGFAEIDSVPGQGTVVSIYLPRPFNDGTAHDGEDPAHADTVGHARILVVEDDVDVRSAMSQLLHAQGHTVKTVPDAAAALDLLAQEAAFDLVISDIVMPGDVDGLTLADTVAKAGSDTRVLLVTGYNDLAPRTGAADRLGNKTPVLHKPFGKDTFAAAVSRLLVGRELAG